MTSPPLSERQEAHLFCNMFKLGNKDHFCKQTRMKSYFVSCLSAWRIFILPFQQRLLSWSHQKPSTRINTPERCMFPILYTSQICTFRASHFNIPMNYTIFTAWSHKAIINPIRLGPIFCCKHGCKMSVLSLMRGHQCWCLNCL